MENLGNQLAIVRSYVGLLCGDIAVRSSSGSGSTFTVTLPYRPPSQSGVHHGSFASIEPYRRVAPHAGSGGGQRGSVRSPVAA